MSPATQPRSGREGRLLKIDAKPGGIAHLPVSALPDQLRAGDVVVLNDAATLPASFPGTTAEGSAIELRLAGPPVHVVGDGKVRDGRPAPLRFRAILFGEGDWRTPTEQRPPPRPLGPGEVLALGEGLTALVENVDRETPRLLEVTLLARASGRAEDVWPLIYRRGRPVQYAHLHAPLHLWDVQNLYADRPWAFEMPSAGRALDGDLIFALRRRGIRVAAITHGAGLSSTGDRELDQRLPFDEDFEIPLPTAAAIARAQRRGGRVIAIGTSVVRALESAASRVGRVEAIRGRTGLRLGEGYARAVVDGIVSGVHEPGTSHFELLCAFAARSVLLRAHREAEAAGYLGHEFGDFTLVMGETPQRLASALST